MYIMLRYLHILKPIGCFNISLANVSFAVSVNDIWTWSSARTCPWLICCLVDEILRQYCDKLIELNAQAAVFVELLEDLMSWGQFDFDFENGGDFVNWEVTSLLILLLLSTSISLKLL